jgi:sialate O-acetylesterase
MTKSGTLLRTGIFLLFGIPAIPLHGMVRLPALFANYMVIQRDQPVHVWGFAAPNETVTVTFRGQQQTTAADGLGRWSVELPPGAAGGPFALSVRATNTITLTDVLVGDVWVASGQSNMGYSMSDLPNSVQALASAHLPLVRLMSVDQRPADYPQDDVSVLLPWSACTPESARGFSAVAYYFARDLEQREHIPIGIIESAWGGTPAEAWTSMRALSQDASLMPVFSAWAAMQDAEPAALLAQAKERSDLEKQLGTDRNLQLPWHPVFPAWAPAALYNGMIAPLTPYRIRGVIWYQGESNTDPLRYPVYARLFQTLIEDWRAAWSDSTLPFLYVQIANYRTGPEDHWPEIREAQREALALRNTAMVVTIDIGDPDNIHPADKRDVGYRLALAARAIAYGEHIEYSGPVYRTMSVEGSTIRLSFDHAEGGLVVRGGELRGFEIAGSDGHYVPASARADGTTVMLSSPGVAQPTQARYGWADNPDCTLFNQAGLPASPFVTSRPWKPALGK